MIRLKEPIHKEHLVKILETSEVIVAPFEHLVPSKYIDHQTYENFLNQSAIATSKCHEFVFKDAGPKYNTINGKSTALIRQDFYFRPVNAQEALEDFFKYEDIFRNKNAQNLHNASAFGAQYFRDEMGRSIMYYGPDRIIKSVFTMIIGPGSPPEKIDYLKDLVDSTANKIANGIGASASLCQSYICYDISSKIKFSTMHPSGVGYSRDDMLLLKAEHTKHRSSIEIGGELLNNIIEENLSDRQAYNNINLSFEREIPEDLKNYILSHGKRKQ